MPHPNTRGRKQAVVALAILMLACLGLTACGSSSTSSSSDANATAATSTSASTGASSTSSNAAATPGTGRGSARFSAMRECLQKNGLTLPTRTPGARPGSGGFLGAGGGQRLPKGVTRAQYEAALKKCGGHVFAGGAPRRLDNPVFKAALTKYGACLSQNGIKLPAPNTSGNGPIFDTKGVNVRSPQFKAASEKCRSTLIGAFRRPAGARGAAGSGTAPAGASPAAG